MTPIKSTTKTCLFFFFFFFLGGGASSLVILYFLENSPTCLITSYVIQYLLRIWCMSASGGQLICSYLWLQQSGLLFLGTMRTLWDHLGWTHGSTLYLWNCFVCIFLHLWFLALSIYLSYNLICYVIFLNIWFVCVCVSASWAELICSCRQVSNKRHTKSQHLKDSRTV